jgi:hypothetical protein
MIGFVPNRRSRALPNNRNRIEQNPPAAPAVSDKPVTDEIRSAAQ